MCVYIYIYMYIHIYIYIYRALQRSRYARPRWGLRAASHTQGYSV